MTDKFEEWLEEQVDIAARTYYHNKTLESVLIKYREFLKEQPKRAIFTNNQIGDKLNNIAFVLAERGLTDEAETLRVVAARLK